jgi:glutamyl-Q tRNA(Asp) synthetase
VSVVPYVGRFAPSPTGPLHLGSLLAAVASFLAARQRAGQWLVRIEDIDPLREMPGAASEILRVLDRYDLHWDGSVLYQSTRLEAYRQAADSLIADGLAYYCACSRAEIRQANLTQAADSRYPGTCRDRGLAPGNTAIRVRAPARAVSFVDLAQGAQLQSIDADSGDYVIFRRDGLPAYHLAVVVDDAFQSVTDIVRGSDLLGCTAQHLHLQSLLQLDSPRYTHVPVLIDSLGQKLSKQTGAAPVATEQADAVAFRILRCLGFAPPADLRGARPETLWSWAASRWDASRYGGQLEMPVSASDGTGGSASD